MRRSTLLLTLPLLLGTGPLVRAQAPHMGFTLNLLFPAGDFASKSYPPYFDPAAGYVIPTQKETYDVGLGGSFTVSFPMDRTLALRLNLSAGSTNGTNRAAGERTINLRHSQFNLGGDLQIFPQGTAFRHRGFYLLAGLSADFEQFDRSFGDPQYNYYYDNTDTTRKSRLGASAGFGHTFGYDAGMRFTMEATFHKTLTGNDVNAGEPPSTDYVKLGFGFVF